MIKKFMTFWLGLICLIVGAGISYGYEEEVLFGVHASEKAIEKYFSDIERAKDLGVNVIRLPVDWAQLEPKMGKFDIGYVDYIKKRVELANKTKINVVILFSQSPEWANGGNLPAFSPLSGFNIYYARALVYLMKTLENYDNILAWEVWNEPNSIEFWPKFEKPREGTYVLTPLKGANEYYLLLATSYKLTKKYYPKNILLGGSLAGADVDYLNSLWGNFSGFVPMDGLAIHPYTRVDEVEGDHYGYAQYPDQCNLDDPLSPPWCFKKGLENIKKFLDSQKFKGSIWITEFGVSSDRGWGDAGSQLEQLKFLVKAIKILNRYGKKRGIKTAIWYRLIDEAEDKFGLYDEKGDIKLSGRFLRYYLNDDWYRKIPSFFSLRLSGFISRLDSKYGDFEKAMLLENIILKIRNKKRFYTGKEKLFWDGVIKWLRHYEDKYYLRASLK